jgi:hypothetical protein
MNGNNRIRKVLKEFTRRIGYSRLNIGEISGELEEQEQKYTANNIFAIALKRS